jgi:hypothetical protein
MAVDLHLATVAAKVSAVDILATVACHHHSATVAAIKDMATVVSNNSVVFQVALVEEQVFHQLALPDQGQYQQESQTCQPSTVNQPALVAIVVDKQPGSQAMETVSDVVLIVKQHV